MKASHRVLEDWLSDIEENAAKVVAYAAAMTYDEFLASEPVRDSMQKKLENMGEATPYLRLFHPDFIAQTTYMPWRELGDMRNRLTHGYFDVSPAILWRVALDQVPVILQQVRSLIAARAQPDSA